MFHKILTPFVKRNDSGEFLFWRCDWREWCWWGILKQKLFNTLSKVLETKLNLLFVISRGKENYKIVLWYFVLLSKFMPNCGFLLLDLSTKSIFVNQYWVLLQQLVTRRLGAWVNMSKSIVHSILTCSKQCKY